MKAQLEEFLKIEGLTKSFGGLNAVKDVSFSLNKREILGLIGPNGAGKTTLYNMVSGLLPLDAGRILLDGDDITGLPPHKIVERGIARTFQGTRVFQNLTIAENLTIARHCRLTKQVSFSNSEEKEVAVSVAEFLKLSSLKDKLAKDVPLIYQTLLGIGMALCTEPKLILLDEPSAGLNPSEVQMIMRIIQEVRKRLIPVLLIEHNMKAVMAICDRIVVLNHGEKIAEGSPIEISKNEDVIRAYLGSRYATTG
jgi:branched-chain amino acid transport system ATP-binding protein